MGFSLFSSFRDPDQFCNRPPLKSLSRIFSELSVRPSNLFRIFLETFRPPLKSFQDIFRNFCPPLKSFQAILDKFLDNHFPFLFNMSPLSNSAKTTFIYLSVSVGINLVLLLSSDPMTVIVGFACLVLSLSSLASFYLDQVMLDQEHI